MKSSGPADKRSTPCMRKNAAENSPIAAVDRRANESAHGDRTSHKANMPTVRVIAIRIRDDPRLGIDLLMVSEEPETDRRIVRVFEAEHLRSEFEREPGDAQQGERDDR